MQQVQIQNWTHEAGHNGDKMKLFDYKNPKITAYSTAQR